MLFSQSRIWVHIKMIFSAASFSDSNPVMTSEFSMMALIIIVISGMQDREENNIL